MKIVSIGEVLWDVVGTTEHLGGAPFNLAAHLRQFGYEVYFVSAVGRDERGTQILDEMSRRDLETRFTARNPTYPTGIVSVSVGPNGQPDFVIHRPAAYDFPSLTAEQKQALLSPPPDWIYFGTLLQTSAQARDLTATLLDGAPDARRFYDVNLRVGSYSADLVRELLVCADVVKLNDQEVIEIARMLNVTFHDTLESFCRACSNIFELGSICVTRGAQGCALLAGSTYVEAPGYRIKVADTIGAGDAFAAAFLHGFSEGWAPARIADFANRVGAIVASKPGALPPWTIEEALSLR